jgi:hypothetical protein
MKSEIVLVAAAISFFLAFKSNLIRNISWNLIWPLKFNFGLIIRDSNQKQPQQLQLKLQLQKT